MPTTKTVLQLEFPAPGKNTEKKESKNYDILDRQTTGDTDQRSPIIIGANGALYLRKGLIDLKDLGKVTLTVTAETKK